MDDIDKKDLETIDIETPLDQPSSSPMIIPPHAPRPRRSNKAALLVFLSIVTFLAAAGFLYYWFVYKNQDATITTSTPEASAEVTTVSDDSRDYAKELIDRIRTSTEDLKQTYPNSSVKKNEPMAPAYMYGVNKYYVSGQFGHALVISDAGAYNEAFITHSEQRALSVLEDQKLIKKERQYMTTYINDSVVCSVSKSSSPVYVSCANTRDYKTPSETVQPFANAYFANPNAADESQIVFGQPTITNKSDGYKSAIVSISGYGGTGGFAGLFTAKNNTWTYWTGSQSIIACSSYNTLELQKSFEGEACYIEGEEDSVVIVTLTQ